ncbi:DNA adenine methylase [Tersicoccus sp. MR15.9]|uniref:DNA adenine methylase n=1 Tax=Tersicoccus mangrovi TaxID=3121635 RepID=UPI002FE6390B
MRRRVTISPLRWPGGKGQLYAPVRALLREHGLTGGHVVEPYAGGAGLSLALLVTGQVERITLNDLDPAVYAFWATAVAEPDRYVDAVRTVPLTIDEWDRQKEIYRSGTASGFDLGFAAFYLNRTNHSGVLRANPIGGRDQTGRWLIDARFPREGLAERFRLLGLYAERITVTCRDGADVVRESAHDPDTFLFVDPPYVTKADTLYRSHFADQHHVRLAAALNEHADAKWLLTYDDEPPIPDLYRARHRAPLPMRYSGHRPGHTTELVIFSDALARVAAADVA